MRGSIPAPGPHTRRYGGNTSCVEVRCAGRRLVFDLGSGARALGEALRRGGRAIEADLFLSHYHYDHLQGLPFFTPLFEPRNRFAIHGPERDGQTVEQILAGQMRRPYFPVTVQDVFQAQVEYRTVVPETDVTVGGARVSSVELNHPGGNLGYRVDFDGRRFVYATDIEHGTDADARLARFAKDADLLVYDAMYTPVEYAGNRHGGKAGWGHSTWEAAVRAADASNARKLVLFHHDPARGDAALTAILRRVRKFRPDALAAREGLRLEV